MRPGPGVGPRASLAAGVLAVLTASAPAFGYVRTTSEMGKPFYWRSPAVTVDLYTGGDPPPYLTSEQLASAVRTSAATWSFPQVECTALALTVREVNGTEAPVAYDMSNRITFRTSNWAKSPCDPARETCAPYDSRALAITSVFALKSSGAILDSDMELNGVHYKWADVVTDARRLTPGEKVHDLQNTVTHEFGHLIGLDHNCYDPSVGRPRPLDHQSGEVPLCNEASAALRAATMFNSASPLDIDKRDLTTDDKLAVCQVYPRDGLPPGGGDDDSTTGCATGPGRPASDPTTGALVIAALLLGPLVVLATGRRRRRRFTARSPHP